MKVAAAGRGPSRRRHGWLTAFRRSPFGRAIIRRLPGRVKRLLRAGRRWQRGMVKQMRVRWHRSLQLRVVSTTLVLSALVIAVLGFFLIQSVAGGLLTSAEKAAGNQVIEGRLSALGQHGVLQPTPQSVTTIAQSVARVLQQTSGNTGSYLVFIQLTDRSPGDVPWVGQRSVNVTATIPQDLISQVTKAGGREVSDFPYEAAPQYEPTTLVYN